MAFKRLGIAAGFAALMIIGSSSFTQTAAAQTMPTQVESVPKGAIGLGLIGAELGLVLPVAFGLQETWSMIVFPIVGGAAGAIGGYFAFDEPNSAEAGVAMLAIGMALVVPATVLTLVFTSYDADDEPTSDEGDGFEEEFGDDADATETARNDAHERVSAGAGLVHVGSRNVSLGVPGVSVRPSVTAEEALRYGGEQTAEVHLPVISGAF